MAKGDERDCMFVYNLLKTSKSMPMSVANLLQKFKMNDEHLEANLNNFSSQFVVRSSTGS